MFELSLYILDIAQNSVAAGASNIDIRVSADTVKDVLTISISDDGTGMSAEFLAGVTDPFTTTRKTRKVGMGIPLFKMEAEKTGGTFEIHSVKGKGTRVSATFGFSSVDRLPLGSLGGCVAVLLTAQTAPDILLEFDFNGQAYTFDTRQIKQTLNTSELNDAVTIEYLSSMIDENIQSLNKGVII